MKNNEELITGLSTFQNGLRSFTVDIVWNIWFIISNLGFCSVLELLIFSWKNDTEIVYFYTIFIKMSRFVADFQGVKVKYLPIFAEIWKKEFDTPEIGKYENC